MKCQRYKEARVSTCNNVNDPARGYVWCSVSRWPLCQFFKYGFLQLWSQIWYSSSLHSGNSSLVHTAVGFSCKAGPVNPLYAGYEWQPLFSFQTKAFIHSRPLKLKRDKTVAITEEQSQLANSAGHYFSFFYIFFLVSDNNAGLH